MKLRNKKTGEVVVEVNKIGLVWNKYGMPAEIGQYDSIAELNEEWEDYRPAEKKPKRYCLMKDLPTFKAGEVFEIEEDGSLFRIDHTGDGSGRVMAYHRKTLDKFPSILEEWFEEIKPTEPLIKDEKIRKAVRAWAEALGLQEVYCASNGYEIYGGIDDYVIQFEGEPFPFADRNKIYTIAELCGEEEE